VLTDRGSEFCGNPSGTTTELYLAVEEIDHSRTMSKSPQTGPAATSFMTSISRSRSGNRLLQPRFSASTLQAP